MDVFHRPELSGDSKKCLIRQKRRPKFINSFDFCPVLLETDKSNPEKCAIGSYWEANPPINHISSGTQIKGVRNYEPDHRIFLMA
jgi:hypothetical protein